MHPVVRLRPGEFAPARDRYEVIDRFGERLNVEILCDQGEQLPLIAVVGFNPVFYIRAEAMSAS